MFYLLKKHLLHKDAYFLYKTFKTEKELYNVLRQTTNPETCMIIKGQECDCEFTINITPKEDKIFRGKNLDESIVHVNPKPDTDKPTHRKMDYEK
jgi:hypothetical protein